MLTYALPLSAHLADTCMCIVFLGLSLGLFFLPGQERYLMLRPWNAVLLRTQPL